MPFNHRKLTVCVTNRIPPTGQNYLPLLTRNDRLRFSVFPQQNNALFLQEKDNENRCPNRVSSNYRHFSLIWFPVPVVDFRARADWTTRSLRKPQWCAVPNPGTRKLEWNAFGLCAWLPR